MKKIILITALLAFIISSCSKSADDIVMPKATAQADVSNATAPETLYIWDQLPSDLKNALLFSVSNADKYPAQSFGPYGIATGTGFSSFPPTGSKIYAMGFNADNSGLNKIIIWYKGTDNKIYYYATGSATNFYVQLFTDDEYISKISVYSGTIINRLTITTNKKSFSYGAAGGTLKTAYAPASQILGFWGNLSSTNIAQLYIGAYVRTWTLLPGSDVRDVAVATDGTAYITNFAGRIYRFVNNAWSQIIGSDGRTIAANANRIVLVNTVGKIYEFFGNAWVQLPGSDAKDVAINSDGKIWMVNTVGKIYRYNETSWELMPGLPTGWLSASRIGAGANQVWVVNGVGQLFKWTGSNWQIQTGITANDVAVSSDGIVWITKSGIVYNNYGGVWVSKGATLGANIAANNKTAFLTQSIGSVRNLIYY
ncbi:MAG TPA: jacalin-like lectin [Panacibacter sp.]|nr:jacalin-like lectin [Panacibacter sp.]